MNKLERITQVLDYYASMGVNKERINNIYRKILNDEKTT